MIPTKIQMIRAWAICLKLMFIFFAYHLVRDIFQDILNIHNSLIDIVYYRLDPDKLPSYLTWLNFGGYRKYYTLPIEIILLFLIPKSIKQNSFTKIDTLIIILALFFVVTWLLSIPYSTI